MLSYFAERQHRAGEAAGSAEGETPAEVSMAIGSTYFRLGRMEDAERDFLAATATAPKLGQHTTTWRPDNTWSLVSLPSNVNGPCV